jgi:hypothetical protein
MGEKRPEDGRTLECLEPGIYERRRPGMPSQIIPAGDGQSAASPVHLQEHRGRAHATLYLLDGEFRA